MSQLGTARGMERLYSHRSAVTASAGGASVGTAAALLKSAEASGWRRKSASARGYSSAASSDTSPRWWRTTSPTGAEECARQTTQKMADQSSLVAWRRANSRGSATRQATPPARSTAAVSSAQRPHTTLCLPSRVSPSSEALMYSSSCVLSVRLYSASTGWKYPFCTKTRFALTFRGVCRMTSSSASFWVATKMGPWWSSGTCSPRPIRRDGA
mmetsp:Transcript_21755/g.56670  ORF Transcript_21755/g.56670 Transcript_21755/m.56670 type:complete len:213 (+) Transcript_21755:777-1415(+)